MANESTPRNPETPGPDPNSGDLLRPEPILVPRPPGDAGIFGSFEMMYAGPIPPPAILKQFDKISPGLADKLVENSLEQSRHRRELERLVVEANTQSRTLGMYIGGGLGFTALVGAVITAVMGQPWVAGVLVGAVTGGLVTSFFGSYKRQKTEIEDKAAKKGRITPSAKPGPPQIPEPPEHFSS